MPNLFLLVMLLFSLILSPAGVSAATAPQKVLIIHSYDPSFRVTSEEQEGMLEVFKSRGAGVQLQVEYLDAKQYTDPHYLTEILDTVFRHKLAGRRFDLVLAVDNDALTFVQRHRHDLFAGLPLVFCGINYFSPTLIAGDSAATGIADQPSFRETIDTALSLHPGTQEMIFIGSPRNETGRSVRKSLEQLRPDYMGRMRFTYWEDLPVDEITARLPHLPEHRLVFIYSFVKDRSGYTLSPEASIKAIHDAARAPIYSFWSFFLGKGIVGGKLVSNREQGKAGAEVAVQVLQGVAPATLPIKSLEVNRYQFDYTELKRFGIGVCSALRSPAARIRPSDGRRRERRGEIVAVILDLTMPRMNGEEAFLELRRISADVRVLISSGYNMQEVTRKFVGKDVAGFIQKPYNLETLGKVLKEIVI